MRNLVKAGAAGLTAVSASAFAALPIAASDAITSVNTNITDMIAAIWPLVVAGVVGFGLIKLFKKGVARAI